MQAVEIEGKQDAGQLEDEQAELISIEAVPQDQELAIDFGSCILLQCGHFVYHFRFHAKTAINESVKKELHSKQCSMYVMILLH